MRKVYQVCEDNGLLFRIDESNEVEILRVNSMGSFKLEVTLDNDKKVNLLEHLKDPEHPFNDISIEMYERMGIFSNAHLFFGSNDFVEENEDE